MENKSLITNTDSEALTPADLIKKHNSDPNHIISDEEMQSLRIGLDEEDEENLKKEIDVKEEEEFGGKSHENNSYDILDA